MTSDFRDPRLLLRSEGRRLQAGHSVGSALHAATFSSAESALSMDAMLLKVIPTGRLFLSLSFQRLKVVG